MAGTAVRERSDPARSAPRRVYLHVGAPKTGTTFLQASLRANRDALRAAGVLHPGGEERMFRAALDVRGIHKRWGRSRSEVEGAWDTVCRRAREHDGTTVVSHELLGGATSRQITAAMTMLRELEVHVVVTARDPAHQAVAEWQEGIKHGLRHTFDQFRAEVLDDTSETAQARRFRAAQDLPALLARWAGAVPAGNVHVVCGSSVPGGRESLWQRLGEVVGFDAARLAPAGPEAANASMGVDEVDLLRRVNLALDGRIVQPDYGRVVKQVLASSLREVGGSRRPELPEEMHEDLVVVARRWVKEIGRAGYAVHGDLADLVPVAPPRPVRRPDDVDPRSQVASASAATAELLLRLRDLGADVARLEAENDRLRAKGRTLKRRLRTAGPSPTG